MPGGVDDAPPLESSGKIGRLLLTAQHAISGHRHGGDRSADELRVNQPSDRFDLGELRHRVSLLPIRIGSLHGPILGSMSCGD